ncbi:hypothetical protein GGS20DRAFT_584928 [Poronia punctata]|nr:hypothetical protein GGS20DRAFT_584928 [Poronia punctata]
MGSKGNFSELSSISLTSAPDHKVPRVEVDPNDDQRFKHFLEVVEHKTQVADAAYEAGQKTLLVLQEEWNEGSVQMTRGQYDEEVRQLQMQMKRHLVEKVCLRSTKWETAGRMADAERWNKQDFAADWSYIDLLVNKLQEPSGANSTMKNPRDPSHQERWRKAVLRAYGAEKPHGKIIWCPISHQWMSATNVKVAHIVRYNVGEPSAVYLFGAYDGPEGHIWSVRNGIPLSAEYEELLDDGQIAIVPTEDGEGLMVIVLSEEEISDMSDEAMLNPRGVKLHQRCLKFLNDHRPAMRYLYFCYAINLLRRQRFEVRGWWKDHLQCSGTSFFATPGQWVRETTLRKLARRVGHLPDSEAEEFVAATKGSQLEDPFQDNDFPARSEGEGEVKTSAKEEEEELFTSNIELNVLP